MTTKLKGDGSLFLTEQAAAAADVAGDGQLWVETAAPNILKFTDDAGTDFNIATENKALTTLATEQATTSGTSIDFTGIPSGVNEIKVMLVGVSISGASVIQFQIGDSGGVESTGYVGEGVRVEAGGTAASSITTGLPIVHGSGANIISGSIILSLENSTNFTWVAQGQFGTSNTSGLLCVTGKKSLTAELTQVRITTVNGTDTFDAGSINIQYSF